MANADLPFFMFYPKDFALDERVQCMSTLAKGIYICLLCHQWEHGNVPSDAGAIGRIAGCSKDEATAEMEGPLGLCWPVEDDDAARRYNRRLRKELVTASEKHGKISDMKRAAAVRRWELERQKQEQCKSNAPALQEQCCEYAPSVSASASASEDEVVEEGVQGEKEKEPEPPVLEFQMLAGKSWPLTQKKLAEWQETYRESEMDVLAEVKKARQWLFDNPTHKGKSPPRFVGGWLSRALNNGHYARLAPPDLDEWTNERIDAAWATNPEKGEVYDAEPNTEPTTVEP